MHTRELILTAAMCSNYAKLTRTIVRIYVSTVVIYVSEYVETCMLYFGYDCTEDVRYCKVCPIPRWLDAARRRHLFATLSEGLLALAVAASLRFHSHSLATVGDRSFFPQPKRWGWNYKLSDLVRDRRNNKSCPTNTHTQKRSSFLYASLQKRLCQSRLRQQ